MRFRKKLSPSLLAAITAFIVLDLLVLVFNFQITTQVEEDSVAINLAGRQRMLSQRITKAALIATNVEVSSEQRTGAEKELFDAYRIFQANLNAFAFGGEVIGRDERRMALDRVGARAALEIERVRGLLHDWEHLNLDQIGAFAVFLSKHNLDILNAMEQLTSELESNSLRSASQLRLVQTLAFFLALANFFFILYKMNLSRRQAEIDALTDHLTSLPNRAGIYQLLETALAESKNSGAALGVLLLDLDGFKAVNDNYGHAAGDETLKETARRISAWLAPGWSSGRLGGDEFAVVCPGAGSTELNTIAEDLTEILSGIPGGKTVVSASVGHASATAESRADTLLAMADASMYARKSAKRNSKAYRHTLRWQPAAKTAR